jgi:hypothetical protein
VWDEATWPDDLTGAGSTRAPRAVCAEIVTTGGSPVVATVVAVQTAGGPAIVARAPDDGLTRSVPTTTPTINAVTVATTVARIGTRYQIHRGVRVDRHSRSEGLVQPGSRILRKDLPALGKA